QDEAQRNPGSRISRIALRFIRATYLFIDHTYSRAAPRRVWGRVRPSRTVHFMDEMSERTGMYSQRVREGRTRPQTTQELQTSTPEYPYPFPHTNNRLFAGIALSSSKRIP